MNSRTTGIPLSEGKPIQLLEEAVKTNLTHEHARIILVFVNPHTKSLATATVRDGDSIRETFVRGLRTAFDDSEMPDFLYRQAIAAEMAELSVLYVIETEGVVNAFWVFDYARAEHIRAAERLYLNELPAPFRVTATSLVSQMVYLLASILSRTLPDPSVRVEIKHKRTGNLYGPKERSDA